MNLIISSRAVIANILLTAVLLITPWTLNAQSSDFTQLYEACIKINDGLSDGLANAEQISSAARTLSNLKIGSLPLNFVKGQKQSLNGHLVFTSDFINKALKDKKVYEMADEYARKNKTRAVQGATLRMETLVIPAGKTFKFELVNYKGSVDIGCVAETNGFFSWKITTETMGDKKVSKTYKDNADEKIGRTARQITLNGDSRYKIIVEIKNTTDHDSSFAVITKSN